MEFKHYLTIVRRWLWLLVLLTLVGGALGFGISLLSEPVYRASATLLISQAPSGQISDYTAIITSERLARTYAELIIKRPVLEEVANRLGPSLSPNQLEGMVSVELVRDTQLLVLSVQDTDPARAAELANLIPTVFIEQNQQLQDSRYAASKQSLSAELDTLNQQIIDTEAAIGAMGTPATAQERADLDRLQTQLTSYRQSYTGILQTYESIRLAEAQSTSTIIVAESAATPTVPVRPRKLFNTGLAGMVGFLSAAAIALLAEYLDDSIKTPEHVRSVLGLPVLGVLSRLPTDSLKGGPIALSDPRSPATEAYRALRTNIQFSALDKPLRRILVASSGPGEGKSTVAANLGVVMAQAGLKVILLDGDLRRPTLHKVFNTTNPYGLTHLMLHPRDRLKDAMTPTSVPNLYLLATGPLPPNPAEMLASQKMTALLEEMTHYADVVIVDSPPISAVTDATVLSGKVDGVVLVVNPGSTRIPPALHAKEDLERAGATILGVAANRVTSGRSGTYYYINEQYYGEDGRGNSTAAPRTNPQQTGLPPMATRRPGLSLPSSDGDLSASL